jgi:hypothetical protein
VRSVGIGGLCRGNEPSGKRRLRAFWAGKLGAGGGAGLRHEGFQFADGGGGAVLGEELGADLGGAAGVVWCGGKAIERVVELLGPDCFFEPEAAAEALDLGAEKLLSPM